MPPKSFKFRLQSILDYKKKREDEEKEKLAKLMQALSAEEKVLLNLQHLLAREKEEYREKQRAGTLNLEELKMYHAYIKKVENDIVLQTQKIQKLNAEVENQRQQLLKATQEKKVFEKLKDKHHGDFLQEIEEEERKMIDELATVRYKKEGN